MYPAPMRLQDTSWSGDASAIDANEDGWVDLYVLNMQGPDHYYENAKGQYFTDKSRDLFPCTPWGVHGHQGVRLRQRWPYRYSHHRYALGYERGYWDRSRRS